MAKVISVARALACAAAVVSCTCASASISGYTAIDVPGAQSTSASGISGNNIVGSYRDTAGRDHGFLFNGSTYTTLNHPLAINAGGLGTYAYSVFGNTVVGAYNDSSGIVRGFLYDGINWTTINHPGAQDTQVNGIQGGVIVGDYDTGSGDLHGYRYDGVTWTAIEDPVAVNGTGAHGINGSTIVGRYRDAGNNDHGFIYDGSTYTTFDPGANSRINAISGGRMVGVYHTGSVGHGYVYDGSTVTTLDHPSAVFTTSARGIDGFAVVGTYVDGSATSHGYLVYVPEPGSFTLAAAASLALLRRRRSK